MTDIITKLKHISDGHRIYLYGAGVYGRTLYAFMKEQDIGQIEAFLVSGSDTQRTALGECVIPLEEYAAHPAEKDLIIVAVSEMYSAEIARMLESREIHHYAMLTPEEWNAVECATLFDCITPQKNIAILMYHRVIESDYYFWKLNVSPKTFEKHMEYLSENYKFLRLEEKWETIVEPNQKYVVITFDDGYVDNYRFALPILEKYHIPATVFVSTDLIDTDEMYWWDELEKIFVLDRYIGEFMFGGIRYRISNLEEGEKACIDIRNRIRDMNPIERKGSMGRLRLMLGLERQHTSELRCVNTPELVRMSASPYVAIGCHTKSHLSMGCQHSEALLRSEIEESICILEEKTGKKIKAFAYPFGGQKDLCDTADQIISECGIKKSLLVRNGNVNVKDKMYHLPRHMIFENEDIDGKMRKIWGIYG